MGRYSSTLMTRLRHPWPKTVRLRDGDKPDKGRLDGSCNRTACQTPLAGREQWRMKPEYNPEQPHYCGTCARDFHNWDRRIGAPLRCEQVSEETFQ